MPTEWNSLILTPYQAQFINRGLSLGLVGIRQLLERNQATFGAEHQPIHKLRLILIRSTLVGNDLEGVGNEPWSPLKGNSFPN